jgi:hypothetical protein
MRGRAISPEPPLLAHSGVAASRNALEVHDVCVRADFSWLLGLHPESATQEEFTGEFVVVN